MGQTADYMTVREAAAELLRPPRTVQHWIATGRLPAEKFGGAWSIAREDVEAFKASLVAA